MNSSWAQAIIDHLIQQGVSRFCIAPGSRSTPLAYAVATHPDAKKIVHFDERGASFYAFGFAKGSGTPAAIICTSGSAIGNLYPAVMEAFHEQIPLIIISADRPPELQECGANQTCDQVDFFKGYVRFHVQIPCPDTKIPGSFLSTTIAQAVYRATHSPKGPVHINCAFREPFFDHEKDFQHPGTFYESTYTTLSQHSFEVWSKKLASAEKGVFVIGDVHSGSRSLKPILSLAEQLNWPVLPTILSGMRSQASHPNSIPYYHTILRECEELLPDCIVQLGDRLISKTVTSWLAKAKPSCYLHVSDHPFRHDPNHIVTHRIQCDSIHFCEQLLPYMKRRFSWLNEWQNYSLSIATQVESKLLHLSEPSVFHFLQSDLPAHWALFIGNSLPIRDAENYFFPRFFRGPIIGKRGLSGIDGNIATAIGLAEGCERPTLAIIGDMTTLHDLNSFAMAQTSRFPVIFLIVNNQGGSIFHHLPIAEKTDVVDPYFVAAHKLRFEAIASMFDLPYYQLSDWTSLHDCLKKEQTAIVEMNTHSLSNLALRKSLEALSCKQSPSCTAF